MPINDKRFDQISNNDPKIQKELLTLYFSTFDRALKNMTESIADNDETKWTEALHELKGAAESLGINKVGTICQEIEEITPPKEEKPNITNRLKEANTELALHITGI